MTYFRQFLIFLRELVKNRRIIIELTKSDFRQKYLGSYLGIIWAFVHPTIYMFILWYVFTNAFKSMPVDNAPFLLWMMSGIIPWFFFSESLLNATNSIIEYTFIVKKVTFSIGMLPLVKILSALIIHFFFIIAILIICLCYGYKPSIYNLQVFYYLFASIILLLGISWLTSSLVLFMRDVGQIVNMILQFMFWLTPLFWSTKLLSPFTLNLIKLNPVYYLVQGYRDAFVYKVWFWEGHYMLSLYFWMITGFFFVIGGVVFRKLRPHFADVL